MATANAKKTGKKTPEYATLVPPGTVIGVPIGDGKVAFARVLDIDKGGVAILEVFRKTALPANLDDSVLTSGWLVPPFAQTAAPILDGEWPVLRRGEAFELPAPQRGFELVYGSWPFWHKWNIHRETIAKKIPAEEAARLLPTSLRSREAREEQIRSAVAEGRSWKPGEPDPEWAALVHKSVENAKNRG